MKQTLRDIILPAACIFSAYIFSAYIVLNVTPPNTLNGTINDRFVKKLSQASKKKKRLIITSAGGEIKAAEKAAEIIAKAKSDIIVKRYCLSACSEYVLPSANTVTFQNNPLIGFHWNPGMNFEMLERYGGDTHKCDMGEAERYRNVYRANGLNPYFYRETEKKLVLRTYKIVNKPNECPWKIREFEYDFWFPNSQQLRELMGLKFTGAVCSDNVEACKTQIDRLGLTSKRFVIGDTPYISR